jgi:hypothetical protein
VLIDAKIDTEKEIQALSAETLAFGIILAVEACSSRLWPCTTKPANVALALKAATRLRSSLQHARSIVANMSLGTEVGIPIAFSGYLLPME